MPFKTFGPFSVRNDIELKMDALAAQFASEQADLKHASGVYVFATCDGEKTEPVYVGKAQRQSFGARLPSHLNAAKFDEVIGKNDTQLIVFLVACVDDDGRLLQAKVDSHEKFVLVHEWEASLIGLSKCKNPQLLNKINLEFSELVPLRQYLESASEESSASAWKLANILKK